MNLNYDPVTNTVGKDIPFQRIRRITGYLVGDISRFNNGKRAELNDRVKHVGKGGYYGRNAGTDDKCNG